MKNSTLLFCFLLVAGMAGRLPAQNPFAKPGLRLGAYHFNFFDGQWNTSIRYAGDTLLCGKQYQLFENVDNNGFRFLLHYENGGEVRLNNVTTPCSAGSLYYNFNLKKGDIFQSNGTSNFVVDSTGSFTLLTGEKRRYVRLHWTYAPDSHTEWVDGIGDLAQGLAPISDFEGYERLVCARDSSGDLWLSPTEGQACDSLTCGLPLPKFDMTVDGQTVYFQNQSQNSWSYTWDFGDGESSAHTEPFHTYAAPGCYYVCLTARTPCLERSFTYCRTVNAGQPNVWQKLPIPLTTNAASLSFPTRDTGWVLTSRQIWKTTDGGQNWEQQTPPPDAPNAQLVMNTIKMFDTQTGLIACGNYHYSSGVHPDEGNVLWTNDGGKTWTPVVKGTGEWAYSLEIADAKRAWAGGGYTLFRTLDGGNTWTTINLNMNITRLHYIGGDTLFGIRSKQILGTATFEFFLVQSFDSGKTWPVQVQLPDSTWAARFFSAQQAVFNGGLGDLQITADGAGSFSTVHIDDPLWQVQFQYITHADPDNGWAAGRNGRIAHTTDGWKNVILLENCGSEAHIYGIDAPAADVAYAINGNREVLRYCPNANCATSGLNPEAQTFTPALLLWPNPADSQVFMALPGGSSFAGDEVLELYSASGQLLRSEEVPPSAIHRLDVSGYPPGVYLLRMRGKTGSGVPVKLMLTAQ